MQLTTALKDKIAAECESVESAIHLLAICLHHSYLNLTTAEGLSDDGEQIEAYAVDVTYLPVSLTTGARKENVVVRMSAVIDPAHQFTGKKWQLLTPLGSASDTPPAAVLAA